MPDDALLSVEGLRSGYGGSPVLLGVDLDGAAAARSSPSSAATASARPR